MNKNVVLGFAVGFGVGTVIGLLFAPESGEETRELLKESSEGLADAVDKLMFNLRWMLMTPRERYAYHWNHGGSLRELRKGHPAAAETGPVG